MLTKLQTGDNMILERSPHEETLDALWHDEVTTPETELTTFTFLMFWKHS